MHLSKTELVNSRPRFRRSSSSQLDVNSALGGYATDKIQVTLEISMKSLGGKERSKHFFLSVLYAQAGQEYSD